MYQWCIPFILPSRQASLFTTSPLRTFRLVASSPYSGDCLVMGTQLPERLKNEQKYYIIGEASLQI